MPASGWSSRPSRIARRTASWWISGLVGEPVAGAGAPLLDALCAEGFVPVIACIGASRDGRLFNVNADTLAGSLAARLGARAAGDGRWHGWRAGRRRADDCDARRERDRAAGGSWNGNGWHGGEIARLPPGHRRAACDVAIADGRRPARLGAGRGQRPARLARVDTRFSQSSRRSARLVTCNWTSE